MQRRSLLLLAALALAACDKQPAGPVIEPPNTGAVVVRVQRDTALGDATTGDTAKFAAAGNIRVNVFIPGDTLPVRQAQTSGNGSVSFVGLAPGQYIVVPATTPLTEALGRGADTITVVAGDTTTITSRTIRVRLGASIAGRLTTTVTDQDGATATGLAGVPITIERETGLDSDEYATFATTTTNATGNFSVPVLPGRLRYRVVFDETGIAALANDTLLLNGSGTDVAIRGTRRSSRITIAPGAASTQNFTYRYNTRITGAVFRDDDGDGEQGPDEGLRSGDQVVVQLRNAAGDRVITTTTVTCSTAAGCPASSYSFTGLAGGTYTVTVDPVGSRWADTFPFVAQPVAPRTATLDDSLSGSTTVDIGVIFAP